MLETFIVIVNFPCETDMGHIQVNSITHTWNVIHMHQYTTSYGSCIQNYACYHRGCDYLHSKYGWVGRVVNLYNNDLPYKEPWRVTVNFLQQDCHKSHSHYNGWSHPQPTYMYYEHKFCQSNITCIHTCAIDTLCNNFPPFPTPRHESLPI